MLNTQYLNIFVILFIVMTSDHFHLSFFSPLCLALPFDGQARLHMYAGLFLWGGGGCTIFFNAFYACVAEKND